MSKKYSLRFWIIFWTVSVIFLFCWYFFLEVKNNGFGMISRTAEFLPLSEEFKGDIEAVVSLADLLMVDDDVERTYLLLFQNYWELRPGGGFIGSFGVLKVKNGFVKDISVHDTANFDGRIPSIISPPFPMKETLGVDSWKLRDSNYSPDFPTNAENALMFYEMGKGEEKFNGVIGITTDVLLSALEITGPVEIEGFPGRYGTENAIELLQYQVEKGFVDQGIKRGDRKVMLNDLAKAVLAQLGDLDISKKIRLARVILDDLYSKDIQLYFKDSYLNKIIQERSWGGITDSSWKNDYLLLVDANLGALKSDRLIERKVSYSLDFTKERPRAVLSITYTHNGKTKDWKTGDYQSYLRIYVPEGSWLESTQGLVKDVQYGNEFGKKYFGTLVQVPLNSSKTFTFEYTLPSFLDGEFYNLKIQKQAGLKKVPYAIEIMDSTGKKEFHEIILDRDITLNESK
ncbi:MAG: DUF4012 domain-containing protein [Candidatus Moraniibacteriota bacterium]|nr:MAG: DUF4012 domain-containing protein [Candidatus Moranbacteria bacterium]